jgi:hypothetical protein
MPHPVGLISVELERTGKNGLSGFVELPENLTGIFKWNGKEIQLQKRTLILIDG